MSDEQPDPAPGMVRVSYWDPVGEQEIQRDVSQMEFDQMMGPTGMNATVLARGPEA